MAITLADIRRYNDKYLRLGPDDCWPWTASLNAYGYGQFRWDDKDDGTSTVNTAHRFGWQMRKGPIPKGMEIDHLCGTTACQNPAHWELVTKKENVARGNKARARRRLELVAA